jgi:hypothetical protein
VFFFFAAKIVNHGGCQGNKAQALGQWQHLEASRQALDVLHQAMHPALFCHISMAIEITSKLPEFFLAVDFVVGHNRS